MREEFKNRRALVKIQGSRAVKQKDTLTEENAHTILYAHKLAQVALNPLGVEVLQYRLVRGTRQKIDPENPGENNFFLVSKRLAPTETSKTFFKHYYQLHSLISNCGHCETCQKHEADGDKLEGPIKNILSKAGFWREDLDTGYNNTMFTRDGPVLLEILPDDCPRINTEAQKEFGKHFDSTTAANLREIMAEYSQKMAEIAERKRKRLEQQGIR